MSDTLLQQLSEGMLLYRKRNNITQEQLAKTLGISRSYLSDIENQRKKPSFDLLEKINELIGLF